MANEAHAMLWVHTTLWETQIMMYEQFVGKLTSEQKEKYYQETKLFAYLFGIPEEIIPPTWNDFMEYNVKSGIQTYYMPMWKPCQKMYATTLD